MRYPDSFGQRRKKLGNDLIYNIFELQFNLNSGCRDIATQSFYHIRAYRKNPQSKLAQNRTVPSSNRYLTCQKVLTWYLKSFLRFRSPTENVKKNKKMTNSYNIKRIFQIENLENPNNSGEFVQT